MGKIGKVIPNADGSAGRPRKTKRREEGREVGKSGGGVGVS